MKVGNLVVQEELRMEVESVVGYYNSSIDLVVPVVVRGFAVGVVDRGAVVVVG